MVDVPQDILDKYGSNGGIVFKKAHTIGKLEGAKVAKSEFATEVNNVSNSIINAKGKEDYKKVTAEDVGTLCASTFKYGGDPPSRDTLKKLFIKLGHYMVSEPVLKKAKKPDSSTSTK